MRTTVSKFSRSFPSAMMFGILAGMIFTGLIFSSCQKSASSERFVVYETFHESDAFKVKVNGQPVFTAKEHCFGDSIFHTAQFTVENETEIVIEAAEPISKFEIRPFSKNIKGTVSGKKLTFSVNKPEMLMVTINQFKPLCLFQTPPETDIPDLNDQNVLYFKKGVHEVGEIKPQTGQTIYLEQGAVVKGRIYGEGVQHVTIRGRGILDARGFTDKPKKICGLEFRNSSNIKIEGIGLRSGEWWQSLFVLCNDVEVEYMNLMSFGLNNDGIDIDGVTNFRASNCFIGCGDDGFGWHAVDAIRNGEPPTENCIGEDCVIYNAHAGNGLRVGASMETKLFKDIIFRNIDVLEHINAGIRSDHSDWATCENIVFENFHVETRGKINSFIDVRIEKTRYSNDNGYRDERGNINGLKFINVTSPGGQILLGGASPDYAIRNVEFKSCMLGEKPLRPENMTKNEFVYDMLLVD